MTTIVLLLLLLGATLALSFRALRALPDPQSRRWRVVIAGLALALLLGIVFWLAMMALVVGPELRGS